MPDKVLTIQDAARAAVTREARMALAAGRGSLPLAKGRCRFMGCSRSSSISIMSFSVYTALAMKQKDTKTSNELVTTEADHWWEKGAL